MAVDLKSNGFFRRVSLIVESDSIVLLEHDRTRDRVRRIMLDRVEHIVVWSRISWPRILVLGLFLGLPGLLLTVFVEGEVARAFSIVPMLMGFAGMIWYLIFYKSTLRITRAGRTEDIVGFYPSPKLAKVVQSLVANTRQTQQAAWPQQPS